LFRTAREVGRGELAAPRDDLIAIDERWADPAYWRAIQRASARFTPFYLLSAVDHRVADDGGIVRAPPERSIYVDILGRTLWISLVVTLVCLVLGYPVAHQLASLPTRWSNILMVFVLLPFWTSLLVRISAWVILLQERGPVNDLLLWLEVTSEPLQLIFNRTGIYISMVHVMLPFMVLPLFSVMKSIPPDYMRAAAGLGASPLRSFFRVYFPLTRPGVWSGCLLCFIISIGYYVLPALVGGPGDQMIAYFIAFYTNATINWGLASALGVVLLACVGLLFGLYSRVSGEAGLSLR
jgi:putative spermidine/putrescine transport system permease protein